MRKFAVSEPQLDGNEREYVLDCLRKNRLSMGNYVRHFEESFAHFAETRFAVSCMNGTAALHLAMLALDVKPGDEVIVPAFTYVATANAVTYCGGVPVFCDVDTDTWCMDPNDLESRLTEKTVGVMPVHMYGHPAPMNPICEFADKHHLWVVEDAAEAHGATYRNQVVGGLGDIGVFSFYGNKIVTCGEGGMLTMNDSVLNKRAILYRGQGVDTEIHRYHHSVVGYNYRMTELQAAVGLAQMERIHLKLRARDKIAQHYRLQLAGSGIQFQKSRVEVSPSNWMVTILLPDFMNRDQMMKSLDWRGIETRPTFRCMHHLPIYASQNRYPVSERISHCGINLPTHAGLSNESVDYIVNNVIECLAEASNEHYINIG